MDQKKRDLQIQHIIRPFIHFWEGSDEPWWVKNTLSRFVYANRRLHKFICLPVGYNIEGRFDGELPSPVHECEQQFQAHDRMVEKARDRIALIGVQRFDGLDYLQAWYTEKMPLMNESGEVVGVICHGKPVEKICLNRLKDMKIPSRLVFSPPGEIFNSKEWEIIFYTCQLYTPRMIEEVIGIPNRTVEDILGRIYKKTGVRNKRGLIDYCIEQGFDNFIPQSILQS